MNRLALLLALLLVSASANAQDREADEKKLGDAAQAAWDAFNAIPLCEEFLERFPDSLRVAGVLARYLDHATRTPETRRKALDILRRGERDRRGWREQIGSRYRTFVENLAGWKFTRIREHVWPSRKERVHADTSTGPARRDLRLFFVPAAAERRALLSCPIEDAVDVLPPREEWEEVATWEVVAGKRVREAPAISKPGTWVVEEQVSGLTNVSVVSARTWLMLVRGCGRDGLVWVFDPLSNAMIEDVEITVRQKDGPTTGTTDRNGIFRFRRTSSAVIVAERGDEVQGVTHWYEPPEEEDASGTYVHVTTDRPVYRPGHEVRFRAVRRDLANRACEIPAPAPVRVDLRDPEGRLIATRSETWDRDGVIAGSFALAEETPLGTWTLVVRERAPWTLWYPHEWDFPEDMTHYWRRPFRVEEYRKPEIRVSFEEAAAGEDGRPRGRIRVAYTTGEPAAGARVEWMAEARTWSEPNDTHEIETHPLGWFFLRPDRYEWEEEGYHDWDSVDGGSGEGVTGPDGTLLVDLLPEEEETFPEARDASEFLVHATVTGLSRMSIEASGTIGTRGTGERIDLDVPALCVNPDEPVTGRVIVRDAEGRPVAGRKVVVSGLEMVSRTEEEDEFEPCARRDLVTGEDGSASFRLDAPKAGRIRVKARCDTARNTARHDVVVACSTSRDRRWRTGREVTPFELLPDRMVHETGDTARILVRKHRGRERYRALLLVETEGIRSVRTVRLNEALPVLTIPITPDMVPSAVVTLVAVAHDRVDVSSLELLVFPRRRMLDVAATPEKDEYAPGDRVRIRLDTRDHTGRPVPAVVELAVVDEAIFALAKDRTEDLRWFFFPMPDHDEETELPPLGQANQRHHSWLAHSFDEDQPQFGSAREGEATFEGPTSPAATDVRRTFSDTMHYDARVRTDANGTATVEIDAPGDLATWRIVARAVSGADRFGIARSKTITRKDVTVRIAAPRFFTVRDEGVVTTVVRNDLPEETAFTVELTAEGLEIAGEPRTVRLAAGGETAIDWPYVAKKAGVAKLLAKALSAEMSDAMEIRVPVLPHGCLQQVTAAGRVDGVWRSTLTLPPGADLASARLEVRASSVASSLKEALPFLAGYPYGCVEQTMSRFLPSVVAARTLGRLGMRDPALEAELPKMVNRGLGRLYRYQHEDGGWGWWEHDETHPFMTAYVVHGLLTAREAGFAVDARTLERGVEALWGLEMTSPTAFGRDVLVRAEADVDEIADVEPKTAEDRAWLTLAGRRGLLTGYRAPENRDTGAAVREVALVLRALHAENPSDPRTAELAGWLLTHRRGRAWHSTLDSAHAVHALATVATPAGPVSVRVRVNDGEPRVTDASVEIPAAGLVAGANAIEISYDGDGMVFASAALRFLDTAAENLQPIAGRFRVTRTFERAVRDEDGDRDWEPIASGASVKAGEELRVTVEIDSPEGAEFVMIESPLPAGAEAWPDEEDREWWYGAWYQRRELRDDRVAVAAREIHGHEVFTFRLRTTLPGTYHVMPARAFSMYEPHETGRSAEFILTVRRR